MEGNDVDPLDAVYKTFTDFTKGDEANENVKLTPSVYESGITFGGGDIDGFVLVPHDD